MGEENLGQQFLGKVVNDSYADLVKPSAEVIGQGLAGVFKVLMFYPRLWGELSDLNLKAKVDDFQEKVQQKYQAIPEERRQLPPPSIVLPLFQALEHKIFDDELRSLFAALLAASMDKESGVHPEFVDFVRRMDSKEAEFLRACFREDASGTSEFGPIYLCHVNFGLRSLGLKPHLLTTKYAGDLLLTMIPHDEKLKMSGHLIENTTVMMSHIYAQSRMVYLLYPMNLNSRDIEIMIDHLITLGILKYSSDIHQNIGLFHEIVKDEGHALISASLPEDFLKDRMLVSRFENSGPLSEKGEHVFEYELSVMYQVLEPTKFGLRFLQLCMSAGSEK